MLFQELNVSEEYDGIWAFSSILHSTYDELKDILEEACPCVKKKASCMHPLNTEILKE